jgi:uncharacterized Zn-finger protein
MRVHTGEKPFACRFAGCDYRAVEQSRITVHERMHTGERPFSCPACAYTTSHKSHIGRHVRRMHARLVHMQ